MIRSISAALLAGVSALALSAPASALENPPACGADPRSRCTTFKHGEVYRVMVPPGDSITVVTAPGSEILTVSGARVAALVESKDPPKEWQVSYEANIAYFTPLTSDMPASSATLTVKMSDGTLLPHLLELNTRAGFVALLPASQPEEARKKHNDDTMFMLTFERYPVWDAAQAAEARRKKAEEMRPILQARAQERAQEVARDRLKQDVFYGSETRRWDFRWRCQNPEPKPCGNEAVRPIEASTNGLHTSFRFNTAYPMPIPIFIDTEGNERDLDFYMARPDLMVVKAAPLLVRFRRDGLVGDALDYEWSADPSANPQTGTTSPNVLRVLKARAPVRPSPNVAVAAPATEGTR